METTVTTVIPTLGRHELRRALKSVLEQTYPTRTLVVTDRTKQEKLTRLLSDFTGAYELVISGQRLNGSQARNLGVIHSDTSHVAFLDDDDWWHSDKIRIQVEALDDAPKGSFSSTSALFGPMRLGKEQEDLRSARRVPIERYSSGLMADYLLARHGVRYGRTFLQTSSLLAPRELVESVRWNESLVKHQDWDLLIRLVDHYGAHHVAVPEVLTYVRQGSEDSVSATINWKATLGWLAQLHVGNRSYNDFILTHVVRPCCLTRDREGVRAGLNAIRWTSPPRFGALAGAGFGVAAYIFGNRRKQQ